MKVQIDTDELIDILRCGPTEHLRGRNDFLDNYADGRAAATLHISRLLAIELMFGVDKETFQTMMDIGGRPPERAQEVKAAA